MGRLMSARQEAIIWDRTSGTDLGEYVETAVEPSTRARRINTMDKRIFIYAQKLHIELQ